MRLPRPRLTIRRLMIVVALVGAALGGEKMRRVRAERASKAAFHESWADVWAEDGSRMDGIMDQARHLDDDALRQRLVDFARERENTRAHERWDREMATKYARAAARPWLPLEPDPPAPE